LGVIGLVAGAAIDDHRAGERAVPVPLDPPQVVDLLQVAQRVEARLGVGHRDAVVIVLRQRTVRGRRDPHRRGPALRGADVLYLRQVAGAVVVVVARVALDRLTVVEVDVARALGGSGSTGYVIVLQQRLVYAAGGARQPIVRVIQEVVGRRDRHAGDDG